LRCKVYPSSLTDAQWAVLQPLLPPANNRTSRGGRPEKHDRRGILDAIFYLVRTGSAWRYLPGGFPPWQTVYGLFRRWRADGTWRRVHDMLRDLARVAAGRGPTPTAAVIDSQSVRAASTVGKHSRGFDGGKRVNGRKRHIAVDTLGLLLVVLVTTASIQDRDAGVRLLALLRERFSTIGLVWADGGYAGRLVDWANKVLKLTIVAYTQLRLGRDLTADLRRPWERPAAKPGRLTPARVRRGFRHLRSKLPTPAGAPKPSRPGPGRPPGSRNRQVAAHPPVGKTQHLNQTASSKPSKRV